MFYFVFVCLDKAFPGQIDKNVNSVLFSEVLENINSSLVGIYEQINLNTHSFTIQHGVDHLSFIDDLNHVIEFGAVILVKEK